MAILATGALVVGGIVALLASDLVHSIESDEAEAYADETEGAVEGA